MKRSGTIKAAHFYNQHDYEKALSYLQNAIKAFEDTKKIKFSVSTGDLTKEWESRIYRLAALSSQRLGQKQLAYKYAKKSLDAKGSPQNKAILSTTLPNSQITAS